MLDEIFPRKTTAEWLDELTAADILVTEVVDYRQLLDNEQARVNGYLQELDHPTAGRVLVSGTPITYNGEVRTKSPPAPEMGTAYGGSAARIRLLLGGDSRVA